MGERGPAHPRVLLNGDTDIVAVAKLASLHSISNEAISDTTYPLAQQIGQTLASSDGPTLDRGLLYGAGPPEPIGVVGRARLAAGADLRAAAITAWSRLLAAGANPSATRIFCHPSQLGAEWSRTDLNGQPVHADAGAGTALSLGPGIPVVTVPTLNVDDVLAVDTSVVYFVVKEALHFEMSPYADDAWVTDSQSMRVKLRAAVAAPLPEKSLRKVTLGNPLTVTATGDEMEATATTAAVTRGSAPTKK